MTLRADPQANGAYMELHQAVSFTKEGFANLRKRIEALTDSPEKEQLMKALDEKEKKQSQDFLDLVKQKETGAK